MFTGFNLEGRIEKEEFLNDSLPCKLHFDPPEEPILDQGWGDCKSCVPDFNNQFCPGYQPYEPPKPQVMCVNQMIRPKIHVKIEGMGDCRICTTDHNNSYCNNYRPITVSFFDVI